MGIEPSEVAYSTRGIRGRSDYLDIFPARIQYTDSVKFWRIIAKSFDAVTVAWFISESKSTRPEQATLFDVAFAASPQSGLAWFCFLFPLIEPDWQISRIRLSEKTHAFAHGWFAVRCGNWTKPYTECRDASENRWYAGRGSLCLSHNHRRSLRRACKSTAL